jgi:DNA invertase Pin-like site-specific DNA recombinase
VIILYAPLSSDGAPLWAYCTQRGWDDVRVLKDAGELTRLVRLGRVEVVLANSLIGLGRSVSEVVAVLREFVSRKVVLIIPGRINTSEAPQVFLKTLDAVEEFKHSVAVERTNAGLNAARRRGGKLGRPTTVNAHREDVARLRAQGRTGRSIAKELGMPSSTVFKIIGQLDAVV